MAPSYKLTYFSIKGLGEPIRLLLSYGGIEFEDHRINHDDWPSIKSTMPFGQVPVLEVDGKLSFQSIAIARYIAKQIKLTGKNDWEDLEIDAIVDTISDVSTKIVQYAFEKDEAIKESLKGPLFDETLPYYFSRLNKIAKDNNGHLALDRLTWADFYFASRVENFERFVSPHFLDGYPNLIAVKDNVFALPAIKAWVAKRPEDKM